MACSRVQRGHHQDVSGPDNLQQTIQARPLHHGPCDDVLVDMGGVAVGAGEPQLLIIQGVGSVVPAAGYAAVTADPS